MPAGLDPPQGLPDVLQQLLIGHGAGLHRASVLTIRVEDKRLTVLPLVLQYLLCSARKQCVSACVQARVVGSKRFRGDHVLGESQAGRLALLRERRLPAAVGPPFHGSPSQTSWSLCGER